MSYTNKGLVEYAKKCLALGDNSVYVYGSFGNKLTTSFCNSKYKQYPKINTATRTAKYKKLCDGKHYGFDCVGLIKSYYWGGYGKTKYNAKTDVSANGMYNRAKVKGKISTMPEKEGLLVQMDGHIGIYIGNGYVIECTISTKCAKQSHGLGGVCKTKLGNRKWLHWLECPYIDYTTKVEEKPKEEPKTTTTKYYKKYTGKSNSIVDALKSIKVDSSFSYRKKIAKANNIKAYVGLPSQNIKMLNLLKQGKLIKA